MSSTTPPPVTSTVGSGGTSPPPARVGEELMAALYQAHHRVVMRFAMRLTFGDRPLAEDITQEAFLRLWRHPEALNTEHDDIRPWLFTVTRRLVMDARRARALRPPEVSDVCLDYRSTVGDELDNVATAHEFRQALDELTARQRAVLVAMYYHGCSMTEAADRLGIPVGTVKSRSYSALRALAAVLIRRGLAPDSLEACTT